MVIEQEPFGYSLMIDLYNVKSKLLDDKKICKKYLKELVKILGMEAQSKPYVVKLSEKYKKKWPIKGTGLSAWIPLIESGIQFHSISAKGFLSVDIYSCKKFDVNVPMKFTWKTYNPKKIFNPDKIEHYWIRRGLKYHEDN